MSKEKRMFEFLCHLIDIQIKKYVGLATFGVGPDARLNAELVVDEVCELLEFAEQLILSMEHNESENSVTFSPIFYQIKFYVEQEYERAYAGWLLDENNVHSPGLNRVTEQLNELKRIAEAHNIDCTLPSKPTTATQKQCEHDSSEIALYILDLAQKIKANPDMEFDENIPEHAAGILRRNALTRYSKEDFAQSINSLHQKHTHFLQSSQLQKGSNKLQKEDAKSYEIIHRSEFRTLLDRYKEIEPASDLFAADHEWFKIGVQVKPAAKTKSTFAAGNTLFVSGVAVGSVLIYMLLAYFTRLQGDSLDSDYLRLT